MCSMQGWTLLFSWAAATFAYPWSGLAAYFYGFHRIPKSGDKDTILMVVCRFTKYSRVISLKHPISTSVVAKAFIDTVFRLHGVPQSIVSDRDKVFTSLFWEDLFKCLGVQLAFSSAYHPQSDGQTERVNQCVEAYLRCMCHLHPPTWSGCPWLSGGIILAVIAIQMSPFQALYGYSPPFLPLISEDIPAVEEVGKFLQERQRLSNLLEANLQLAQHRMK